MKEYYNLLKKIESRPAMWTGELTLKSIQTFLGGYHFALTENKLIDETAQAEPDFYEWIADKLGFRESTAGWPNMILAHTIGLDPKKIQWENYDSGISNKLHEESIRQFYILLEEFVKNED